MPKVSVVMPVYGVERFVGAAIESVLAQTFTEFELIVVDDLSPDNSINICRAFDDSRLRIVQHSENRGLAGARNTGIREATGDYIALLDSDDLWAPDKLSLHVKHLDNNPDVGISFSRSAFIDEHGTPLNAYQMPSLDPVDPGYYLCRNPIGNGSAPVVRRAVFDEIAFEDNLYGDIEKFYFDDQFRQSEDIECWIRIAVTTDWKIAGLSEPLTLYRLNGGGLSANIPKQLATWEAVVEKTRGYAPELIQQWGGLARAFQLRYLARQAIRLKDGKMAVSMCHQSIACKPQILIREPARTLVTLGAAYLLFVLPTPVYSLIEPAAVKMTGWIQRLRINAAEIVSPSPVTSRQ